MNAHMREVLDRILQQARVRVELEEMRGGPTYRAPKCKSCQDSGWISLTHGEHKTAGGHVVQCSTRSPLLRRCKCRPRPVPSQAKSREFS